MAISHAAFERSTVRSDLRLRTLITLSSLGEAFPHQLCKAVGMHAGRLNAVMFGDPPDYSQAFALVPLGLVLERDTPHGRVFAITDVGRRKARQLTSRWARRAEVRRARREAREGDGGSWARSHPGDADPPFESRVQSRPEAGAVPGAIAPAAPSSWSFSFPP